MEAIAQSRMEDRMAPKTSPVPALGVPPAVVGRALTSGGNKPHSQERIVAFFQKNPTGSAAASFLEKEYGEGGKGLSIGGREYALWFNKEGLRIAPGRTAHAPGSTLVPWWLKSCGICARISATKRGNRDSYPRLMRCTVVSRKAPLKLRSSFVTRPPTGLSWRNCPD